MFLGVSLCPAAAGAVFKLIAHPQEPDHDLCLCIPGTDSSGQMEILSKDLLPRQEARLKTGLEMAVKHKDKLLEFDRMRYGAC